MENTKGTVIITLISAILFCAFIVASSISPLSDLGRNANQFNSLGMWLSIAMILIFYLVPLFMYLAGLKWMKYIMAVCCAFGTIIFITTILLLLLIGSVSQTLPSLIGVIVICSLATIVNIMWFFIALRTKTVSTPSH